MADERRDGQILTAWGGSRNVREHVLCAIPPELEAISPRVVGAVPSRR